MSSTPPVWLRGPIPDIPLQLQGIAHGLLEALEEVQQALPLLPQAALWTKPAGAASVGFHLRHIAGATDRLFTYARGDVLTDRQQADLLVEQRSEATEGVAVADLLVTFETVVASAIEQLRSTPVSELDEPRFVGRKKLPSSVRGLLEHGAQHASRHAGQIVTTVKVLAQGG